MISITHLHIYVLVQHKVINFAVLVVVSMHYLMGNCYWVIFSYWL